MTTTVPDQILVEMMDYYRARAPEYDEWWQRQGRYDRGAETNARWFAEIEQVLADFDAFALTGELLELAPGTGNWTQQLLRTATTITAVDASSEMIAINRQRVQSERVTYVLADLFTWQPDRTYDGVFFGFWLSHVPLERLDAFLQKVATALRPGGKLFFLDNLREATATSPDQHLPAADTQVMTRKLNDGRTYEIVKNFFEPDDLMTRFRAAGLHVTVKSTTNYFLYGLGHRYDG
jgi:2-polyprenyl-3-methyl-5-hydroxy-6-metoxy-1,4-benzoquinol methylase